MSKLRRHHQRVSARYSAALAVTRAWNFASCTSTNRVSSSAGAGPPGFVRPRGSRDGSSLVISARMAVRLACLLVGEGSGATDRARSFTKGKHTRLACQAGISVSLATPRHHRSNPI